MTEERRQRLVVLPDGRLIDEQFMREYLRQLDRRNERVTVARLAESDEAIAAFMARRKRSA